ncbi:MAG: glycosyltransferase, partial [Acidimicrobiales bacterium]|nr:glycosyltransferase [Acidimicrobiales bacterium]
MTREGNAVAAERAARNLVRITEAMAAAGATPADGVKPRAAVVSWDLAHNPVGRAYVLVRLLQADWKVDLIGPMWSRFGTSLWPPLSGAQLQVRSFPATDVSDYLPKALAAALQDKYDIVLCSKSRLPGVHLATMIAEWSDAPLIVDLDDDELTFADHRTSDDFEAARSGMIGQLLDEPATKLADECLSYFDARTVVSGPLAARYGGITVRHARNPGPTPGSDRYRTTRALARARCGVLTDELAVLFIGTVREHKGVQDIVAALSEIGRDDVRLHVFTTTSDREVKSFVDQRVADADHLYVTHGPCSMDELGRIMTAADLVVLAQEPDSAISQYQVPAKISDATAVGCPVLVPKMEVFADFESAGLVHTYLPGELTTKMEALLARSPSDNDRRMLQERFLSELGMAVNRARLDEAISRARAARSAEPHHASGPLHEAVNSLYLRKRAATPDRPQPVVRVDEAPPAYDVAFFWKQNDSDI